MGLFFFGHPVQSANFSIWRLQEKTKRNYQEIRNIIKDVLDSVKPPSAIWPTETEN